MALKTFSDYLIKPTYSEVPSRSLVDTSWPLFAGKKLGLPIISANMKTITGAKMAIEMWRQGGLGILHRFSYLGSNPEETFKENLSEYLGVVNAGAECGVSIGVQEHDKARFLGFYVAGARIFCVDVAHGHHIKVKQMLEYMANTVSPNRSECLFIAGNVATPEGAADLASWGADIVKVGIGPGKKCLTRSNTGIGVPQLEAISSIKSKYPNLRIIADGGITNTGDINKALIFADFAMLGNLVAATSETPFPVFKNDKGEFYKTYGGSASGESRGENRFVEGVVSTVTFRGKVKYILREAKQGLQSACAYVNALNLEQFKKNAELQEISGGAKQESKF